MKQIYINGRFLTQRLSGVQRYAREVVTAIDEVIAARGSSSAQWNLVVPKGTICDLDLSHIHVVEYGTLSGHIWEQIDLARVSARGRLLSLGNSGPIFHRSHLVVIHDVTVFRHPENFSWRYRHFHQLMSRILSRFASLATVSEFSRSELGDVLGLSAENILVAPNGADHFGRAVSSADISHLTRGEKYFLFVGSPTPNKNLRTAITAFESLPKTGESIRFIIVGNLNSDVFDVSALISTERVIFTGFLPDEMVASLFKNAEALVFPSIYEGFGIPPLEAMVYSCPVIGSSIPPVREVCGEAALLVSPYDVEGFAEAMGKIVGSTALRYELAQKGAERVKYYRWKKTADIIYDKLVSTNN